MSGNGKNGKKRRRWIWISVIALVLIGVVAGGAVVLQPSKEIDPSKLAAVEKGDIARSVVATGKIQPLVKVEVKSKASGIVKKLYVDYGERVKAGQLLCELDKEQLQAQVREARATLQATQAAQESAKAALERNQVEAEGPDVPFLKKNMERAQQLYKDGLVAKSQVEDTEKAYQMALNKQGSALRSVSLARAEVSRAAAQAAQAQAALDRAEEDLRNSTIVSPMDGLVLSRDVQVGDAVSSILVNGSQATLIMTLGDVSEVYVLGKVDEADIGKVFLDQPARIVVESFKDKKFTGKVTKISPLGKEKDNVTTFEVRVSILNPGGELKANMSANAEVILEEKKGVLLIPESAVIYDKERKASVEIPEPKAEKGRKKVDVKLGISNGVKTELASGLKEGQKVVLQ
ncbi:MAG TPA: efflux RND transporter periplasmic adaptor subunit [Candidatus Acidoferrales bacterium]|jgi:HlyD family secretion protein|nr:efflux RND transporter periplasmic adaptor subunit [Candidatus Acidoferrales bacterium]